MLTKFVLGWSKAILLVCVAGVLATLAYLFSEIRINSDLNTLIKPSDELKWYQDNEYFKQQFPIFEQTALIVVSGEYPELVQRSTERFVKQLEGDSSFHEVFAPGVTTFIQDRRWYFLSETQLEEWLRGVEYNYGPMLRLADEASLSNFIFTLADHLSSNRGQVLPTPLANLIRSLDEDVVISATPPLVDPELDKHYEIIIVRGAQNLDEQLPNAELVARLQGHIQSFTPSSGVSVRLTGEIPLAHEEILAALNGIEIAGLISVVLLALILGFGIRSVRFVTAIFTLLAVGVVFTLGLAVLVVGSFNTLSLIFMVMFFGLGVDFAVHFGLRLREAAVSQDFSSALKETYADIAPALLLCMLTTSIAFLSFTPTAYIGLAELGVISAMGMVVAFVLTMTFLPILLSRERVQDTQFPFTMTFPIAHRKPIVIGFVVLTGVSALVAKDLSFDYSVLAMRDSTTEGMQTLLELQEAGVTTDYSISVIATDAEEARELAAQLDLPVVGGVLGPEQLIPENQANKHEMVQELRTRFASIETVIGGKTDPETLLMSFEYLGEVQHHAPVDAAKQLDGLISRVKSLSKAQIAEIDGQLRDEVDRALVDLERGFGALPFKLGDIPEPLLKRFMTDKGELLLRVQPSQDLANREATTEFILEVSEVVPNIAGRSVVEWGIGDVVVESFWQAALTAFVGIALVLVVFFRSILLAILVLIPILSSLLMTFAICQLTGITLNMANILVVPLIIGLGVDTGIHVVHRMTQVKSDAFGRSSTARAVIISALTTIGTFFSLSFSPHLGAASIGLLLTVAISLLVMVTFVLLPALVSLTGLDEKSAA